MKVCYLFGDTHLLTPIAPTKDVKQALGALARSGEGFWRLTAGAFHGCQNENLLPAPKPLYILCHSLTWPEYGLMASDQVIKKRVRSTTAGTWVKL